MNYSPEVRSIRDLHQVVLETVIRKQAYNGYNVLSRDYAVMNRSIGPRAWFRVYASVYTDLSKLAISCGIETIRLYMAGLTLVMTRSELAVDTLKDTIDHIFKPEIAQFRRLLNERIEVLNEQLERGIN